MRPTLETLEDRCAPSTAPTYHGGLVQQDPAIATLTAGTQPTNFQAMVNTLVNNYLATDLGVFGVRSASWNGNAQVGDPGPLANADVQQLLVQEINAGALPQPLSRDQQYLVILNHPITDVPGAGAYHSNFYDGNQLVIYDVVWATNPAAYDTYGLYHETAEAATDPTGTGWYADGVTNGEIADLAPGDGFNLEGFDAAVVMGPDGQFIAGPTPYTPLSQSSPPPPPSPTTPIWMPTGGVFDQIASWWQQEIDAIVSAWQAWEAQFASIEAQLWTSLNTWWRSYEP